MDLMPAKLFSAAACRVLSTTTSCFCSIWWLCSVTPYTCSVLSYSSYLTFYGVYYSGQIFKCLTDRRTCSVIERSIDHLNKSDDSSVQPLLHTGVLLVPCTDGQLA